MKLLRVGAPGEERPVLLEDGRYYDLRPLTPDVDGRFLAQDGPRRARIALDSGELPETDVLGLRIGAPIARPGAVLCIGQNYAAHAAESGAEPPAEPILFHKSPNTVVGPYDEVLIPRGSVKTDWEAELGVVIGKRARYLESLDEARACVAGYVTSNDVSERAFQLGRPGGQWSKGKSCETFNPVGPWFVPAHELPDPQVLELRSWVNGDPRQDSKTSDMIFGVAEIIWHLSQFLVLEPGDLVNTGTPEGVALSGRFDYLRAGDVMEIEVAGLGRQRTVCGLA
ncbi:2-keto-4-pentenoate hydratase/2-oxohepta-3-ene-1,7-dioic acid hydratase in catechol pathway [Amycolatopsis bartoniae]|uniref:fumarylacetoacetate hydrolase family protein n=1 Tax=Amycolatopsis bartoniae TaxID=941986 RepID=UPI0011952755|nr:fumarylacetoacetate hydrolase family protein [Amycolatopsis bartoniae]MBB2933562.1 2-keto-4-pentenoate hydratase/2-oxohepta-3-ene-1,7-dioic acid hydratase in catechol pathway [Amycolatopsis bartoniae]TVT10742.1 fumarylacetoacetate hydrolase family protein [Amycolatopsis bartoniae]